MAFANAIDRGTLRIADSFVWFSRNPTAASVILMTTTGTRLLSPFNHVYKRHERNLEVVKRRTVEEPMEKLSIGTGVLLVLLFFALYLIVMLVHGWLA